MSTHTCVAILWIQAQPIIAKLSATNDELKEVIIAQLKKSPTLAPYADPVIVQMVRATAVVVTCEYMQLIILV